jgi:aryl-alcohol dehydrogenase-like predicted oxidoreductase
MTFGTEWGWGSDEATCGQMLETYVQGGNFLDTADLYTGGKSEEICGRLIRDRNLRDRVVVATKYTFNPQPGNPNAGGNGRKNLYRALEGSLRRLQTDYIDLYWMHVWDGVTPVEEVVASMNDLVRAGKVRYFGFSDVPAWYAARAQTIAQFAHSEPVIALQLEYSLVEHSIEREHVGMALELGMGICPWSQLASGFLAGKYKRGETGEGRLEILKATGNPVFEKRTDRNWRILDVLLAVAKEIGHPPAEVALNWVAIQPAVASTIIAATKMSQLESNRRALDFTIPPELRARLDESQQARARPPVRDVRGAVHRDGQCNVPVRRWGAR